jgi:hypothetical protein
MKIDSIYYLNINYILARDFANQKSLNDDNYSQVSHYLSNIKIEHEKLIIFDFENVSIAHLEASEYTKKTPLYAALFNFLEKVKTKNLLFINALKPILDVIKDELNEFKNIKVLSYDLEGNQIFWSSDGRDLISSQTDLKPILEMSDENWDLFYKKERFLQLKFQFVSYLIKKRIQESGVIEFIKDDINRDNISKDKHRLRSTPVHVNKYINLKPLFEDYNTFHEICYWIAEKIKSLSIYPKYLVAGSKNALALASGVNLFLKSDILIIQQVSPITSLGNFSNIEDDIDTNSIFAILEDFHCMGTEIKVLKGVLWSLKIDIENHVYSFPVSSTKIYDEVGFNENKIFPLNKIGKEFDYHIFTLTTCPICNDIPMCYHRTKFNI